MKSFHKNLPALFYCLVNKKEEELDNSNAKRHDGDEPSSKRIENKGEVS